MDLNTAIQYINEGNQKQAGIILGELYSTSMNKLGGFCSYTKTVANLENIVDAKNKANAVLQETYFFLRPHTPQYVIEAIYTNPSYMLIIAEGYLVQKNLRKAEIWLKKAAKEDPEYADYYIGFIDFLGQSTKQAYKWYKRFAEQGHADAQYRLAMMYDTGKGIYRSSSKAYEWYLKAAEQDDVKAQLNIGGMYASGNGRPQDYEKAYEWFMKSANNGYASSQYNIGTLYYEGKGVSVDRHKARKWYVKAAEQGHVDARHNLSVLSSENNNPEEAFSWVLKNAEQGDAYAQYQIGLFYYDGHNVLQDKRKAYEWYSQSAEQGMAKAQNNLAAMYISGSGIPQNSEKAFKWFLEAAKRGHEGAQYNIAEMYSYGKGVKQDYKKAHKWYLKAAKQGLSKAHFKLGIMYTAGKGVDKDYNKAAEWFRKPALEENLDAQFNLGTVLIQKQAQQKNIDSTKLQDASKWYIRAALNGHLPAQVMLSEMYHAEGDVIKAYVWASIIERTDTKTAAEFKNVISKSMNVNDIRKANKLAKSYKAIMKELQKPIAERDKDLQKRLVELYG